MSASLRSRPNLRTAAGRTRHYHIKVQAPERPVLTTQLYFPDEPANRRGGGAFRKIFRAARVKLD
jgi:hypothetical protein